MSFRRTVNRHEAWVGFRQAHPKEIAATGLPDTVFSNEQRFLDFLTLGSLPNVPIQIGEMTDSLFLLLETLVNSWLEDGWHQKECTAFSQERLSRFGRYG